LYSTLDLKNSKCKMNLRQAQVKKWQNAKGWFCPDLGELCAIFDFCIFGPPEQSRRAFCIHPGGGLGRIANSMVFLF
jgi:hypothetical protein